MVGAVALRSGDPGFEMRADHLLRLFLVVHGSAFQLHLWMANWFASGQFVFLAVVVGTFCHFIDCVLALKGPSGEWSI